MPRSHSYTRTCERACVDTLVKLMIVNSVKNDEKLFVLFHCRVQMVLLVTVTLYLWGSWCMCLCVCVGRPFKLSSVFGAKAALKRALEARLKSVSYLND